MYDAEDMRVLIIIPAYNEAQSILRVTNAVRDAGYDMVVINDGSTDDTLEKCLEANVPVLNLSANLGIGGAVQTGHIYAFENGYDVDIQFDGDGQHDIASVPRLVAGIREGANLVVGSRFIDDSEKTFRSTGLRRLGIRWLSWLIRFMTGKRIYDITSGFRASDRRAMRLFCSDYSIDYPEPESIALSVKNGLDVVEVPVKMNERQAGASSIGALASVYYMVKVTLAIVIQCITRHGRAARG